MNLRYTTYAGLPVLVEVEIGGLRGGPGWSTRHANPYGRIPGTKGADGEQIDVYLATTHPWDHGNVYKVNQLKRDGSFDEHKFMCGFDSPDAAEACYKAHMPHERFGGIEAMPTPDFVAFCQAAMPKAGARGTIAEMGTDQESMMNPVQEKPDYNDADKMVSDLQQAVEQHKQNEEQLREALGDKAEETATLIDTFIGNKEAALVPVNKRLQPGEVVYDDGGRSGTVVEDEGFGHYKVKWDDPAGSGIYGDSDTTSEPVKDLFLKQGVAERPADKSKPAEDFWPEMEREFADDLRLTEVSKGKEVVTPNGPGKVEDIWDDGRKTLVRLDASGELRPYNVERLRKKEAVIKYAEEFGPGTSVRLKPEFGKRGVVLYATPYGDLMVSWSDGRNQRVNPELLEKSAHKAHLTTAQIKLLAAEEQEKEGEEEPELDEAPPADAADQLEMLNGNPPATGGKPQINVIVTDPNQINDVLDILNELDEHDEDGTPGEAASVGDAMSGESVPAPPPDSGLVETTPEEPSKEASFDPWESDSKPSRHPAKNLVRMADFEDETPTSDEDDESKDSESSDEPAGYDGYDDQTNAPRENKDDSGLVSLFDEPLSNDPTSPDVTGAPVPAPAEEPAMPVGREDLEEMANQLREKIVPDDEEQNLQTRVEQFNENDQALQEALDDLAGKVTDMQQKLQEGREQPSEGEEQSSIELVVPMQVNQTSGPAMAYVPAHKTASVVFGREVRAYGERDGQFLLNVHEFVDQYRKKEKGINPTLLEEFVEDNENIDLQPWSEWVEMWNDYMVNRVGQKDAKKQAADSSTEIVPPEARSDNKADQKEVEQDFKEDEKELDNQYAGSAVQEEWDPLAGIVTAAEKPLFKQIPLNEYWIEVLSRIQQGLPVNNRMYSLSVGAVYRRGLIDEQKQLTDLGKQWLQSYYGGKVAAHGACPVCGNAYNECTCNDEDLKKLSYVRQVGSEWGVYSKDGKLLGKHKTKEDADNQLKAIEVHKHGMRQIFAAQAYLSAPMGSTGISPVDVLVVEAKGSGKYPAGMNPPSWVPWSMRQLWRYAVERAIEEAGGDAEDPESARAALGENPYQTVVNMYKAVVHKYAPDAPVSMPASQDPSRPAAKTPPPRAGDVDMGGFDTANP